MHKRLHPCAAIALLACTPLALAQEKGSWRAASKTARSITGDVAIVNERISINFAPFALAQIRTLQPDEIAAAFDSDSTAGGTANLYRVSIPATRKFLKGNTLCGSDETQWMASYVVGKDLQLAFFSGPKMPVFTHDALSNSPDLCGTYSYVR